MGHVIWLHWFLRIAALMEFVGHGVFGLLGKEAWVPYFQVFGFSQSAAWVAMPIVGSIDIFIGLSSFLFPRRIFFFYMGFWGCLTATLRPFSGEPIWEFIERSYNMAVPLLFLILHPPEWTWKSLTEIIKAPFANLQLSRERLVQLQIAIQLICATMLVGHGLLAAAVQKKSLIAHLSSTVLPQFFGLEAITLVFYQGLLEIILGVSILVWPSHLLFALISIWKMISEGLFFSVAAPGAVWEWIERGGAYICPLLGLIILGMQTPHSLIDFFQEEFRTRVFKFQFAAFFIGDKK